MQASAVNISNISKSLECPVMATPLADAVMLTPCGHTISELAAKNIHRGMNQDSVEKQAPCPLCRRTVTAYYPNLALRSLVSSILGIKLEEALPAICAEVSPDVEVDIDTVPFPGIGARFTQTNRGWDQIIPFNDELVREIKLVSEKKDSLFEEMSVLGYRDGGVAIFLTFKQFRTEASAYLQKLGIKADYHPFLKSDKSNIKRLLSIIAKHNQIPADQFDLIKKLAESGDWTKVTPLQNGENLPPPRRSRFYI